MGKKRRIMSARRKFFKKHNFMFRKKAELSKGVSRKIEIEDEQAAEVEMKQPVPVEIEINSAPVVEEVVSEPVVEPEASPMFELSIKDTKARLLEVAKILKLDVNERLTKQKILDVLSTSEAVSVNIA